MTSSRRPRAFPSVLAVVIIVAAILVAASAVALVHALAGPGGSHNRAGLDAAARAAAGRSGAADASITPRPTPAASSPRPTPAGSHALASPAAAPNPAPAAASQQCKSPQFVTSSPTGGWADGSYYLYNDMWNAAKYSVQQTLYACSSSSWYVVATMNNDSGDGAVKTYPNVHEDFSEPAIASFRSISSTFAEASPHVGIYEDAYDIWLNGVASSGSTEVMIWTENHGQVPSGSDLATVSFGGRSYQVWRSGSYVAFVAATNFTAGTVDLLAIFRWLINAGWIAASSTLGQIDYGAELVSTNGAPATFSFINFSVTTS